jgi:hypothetical protein
MKDFREQYPEFAGIPVVPVNTPDYVGCLESGGLIVRFRSTRTYYSGGQFQVLAVPAA